MIKRRLKILLLVLAFMIVIFSFFQIYRDIYLGSIILLNELSDQILSDINEVSLYLYDTKSDSNINVISKIAQKFDNLSNDMNNLRDFILIHDGSSTEITNKLQSQVESIISDFNKNRNCLELNGKPNEELIAQTKNSLIGLLVSFNSFHRNIHRKMLLFQKVGFTGELLLNILFFLSFIFIYQTLNRAIIKPIAQVNQDLVIIGQGNLSHRINYGSKNEIGDLVENLNKVVANFHFVISSRDELNKEIKKRQKLEESLKMSNLELEHFAFVASHDLKEPLRMVTSFIKLFEQKYLSLVDEKGKEYIRFILDGSNRMRNMIDDLLTVSRLNTQEPSFQKVEMNIIIKKVLAILDLRIKETKCKIDVGLLPDICGDAQQLEALFQNLVDNAIKFSGLNNPVIKIYAKDDSENYTTYFVEDNGIGIDEKDFSRIFQMFQRLHSREQYPGNGIGLFIVEKIVSRHQGNIELISELGKGCEFRIKLPKKNKSCSESTSETY